MSPSNEEPQRYTEEWFAWCKARDEAAEAAKAAKRAQPITRGELRDALVEVTQKMERESGYESRSVEGQMQEMAKMAVAAAFDALLNELGMDRWSE